MRKRNAGFTFIELLIVLTIIGTVLGIGVNALATTLRSSTKVRVFNQVKQSGDLTLEAMSRSVRNAVDVCTTPDRREIRTYGTKVITCEPTPPLLNVLIRFRCQEGTPSTNGAITKIEEDGDGNVVSAETAITSNVKVKEGACSFTASNSFPRRVSIRFILKQDVTLPDTADTRIEIPFQTEVTLRNF